MKSVQDMFKEHCLKSGFQWLDSTAMLSNNPKLLFNISGGVVFEDMISHNRPEIIEAARIASVQRCLRTDGWKKIGVSGKHHLAFDMLGHFSFYELAEHDAKELMINIAWDFLAERVGLSPDYLFATVHPLDHASSRIWHKVGVPTMTDERNTTLTSEKTRCGFRTEIIWRPNEIRQVELWNLVFTQFQGANLFNNPLTCIVCDSGASVDRIVTAKENSRSDYENSLWGGLISALCKRSPSTDFTEINRLADMGKASVLLVSEGLHPGNKVAGYVLRRIIRSAFILCQLTSIPFSDFCLDCCNWWLTQNDSYGNVLRVLSDEADKFNEGLKRGMREFQRMLKKHGSLMDEHYEYLSSTYGIPRSLIEFRGSNRKKEAE